MSHDDDYFDDLDDAISARDDKHAELDRDDIIDEDMSTGYIRDKAARKMQKQVEDDSMFGDDDIALANQIAQSPGGTDIDPYSAQPVMSLQGKVGLRDEKKRRLIEEARFERINPPSVLKGTLGGQQVVDIGGPAIQVINWAGEEAETLPLTVTLALVNPYDFSNIPSSNLLAPVAAYALVQFGNRGFMSKVKIDIGTGCQFTVSGSSIAVQVGMDNAIAANGQSQTNPTPLTGMLSFYPCVRTAPLTRTNYFSVLGATGTFAQTAIPAYAKSFNIVSSIAAASYTVQIFNTSGTLIQDITPTVADGSLRFYFPNDACFYQVSYTGSSGVSRTNCRMIFELSI